MPCQFVIPAKGHQKKKVCNQPESLGGFCVAHQPKPDIVAVTPVTLSWQPVANGLTVDAGFQAACDAISARLDTVCQGGIQAGGMAFGGRKGPLTLLHDTQPRINNAFFYRWVGNVMMVYGVGGHEGSDNKHYALTWYTGANASVDLNKKTIE